MSYQVPQHIDKNKVFIVNRSEIEGRLDAQYYNASVNIPNSIKLSSFALVKGGKRIPKGSSYSNEHTPYYYLRVADMDSDYDINYDELKCIDKDIFDILERYEIREGELAISIAGTIGKVCVLHSIPIGKRVVLTENCAKIIVKSRANILTDYLNVLFLTSFIQKQLQLNYVQTTIPKLGLDRILNLRFPAIPSIELQTHIIQIIQSANTDKQKKESKAQQLLDSIDTYLLNELGVSLPEVRNELKDRVFLLNRSELEGRFDPTVYKDGIKLISPKWDNEKLSKVAFVNPRGAYKGKTAETPISFVPMEVIDETFSEITTMDETTIEQASGFTKFREGDLLWAKITPCMQNGKSAIAKNLTNGLGCGSTEFFVMRPKDERLAIEYLHVILHMKCVRETAMLYFGGSAGQQRVSSAFLENFNLPLPPKDKQIEIANHVYTIRQKAKALQEEGKSILESAKQEVERMILQ